MSDKAFALSIQGDQFDKLAAEKLIKTK